LAMYRRLMRGRETAFMTDKVALRASRQKIRKEIYKHQATTCPEEITQLVTVGDDVVNILQRNVAQAKLQENGNYACAVPEGAFIEGDASAGRGGGCSPK